jgi:hypothetical protein
MTGLTDQNSMQGTSQAKFWKSKSKSLSDLVQSIPEPNKAEREIPDSTQLKGFPNDRNSKNKKSLSERLKGRNKKFILPGQVSVVEDDGLEVYESYYLGGEELLYSLKEAFKKEDFNLFGFLNDNKKVITSEYQEKPRDLRILSVFDKENNNQKFYFNPRNHTDLLPYSARKQWFNQDKYIPHSPSDQRYLACCHLRERGCQIKIVQVSKIKDEDTLENANQILKITNSENKINEFLELTNSENKKFQADFTAVFLMPDKGTLARAKDTTKGYIKLERDTLDSVSNYINARALKDFSGKFSSIQKYLTNARAKERNLSEITKEVLKLASEHRHKGIIGLLTGTFWRETKSRRELEKILEPVLSR